MKFFRKRSVALTLCVLLVLASTLGNTRWKLGGQVRRLENSFYAEDGVAPRLETIVSEGKVLADVAVRNGLNTGGLSESCDSLLRLLQSRSTDIDAIYRLYDALRYELRDAENKLVNDSFSQEDTAAVSRSLEQIHSAQSALSASNYNLLVRQFLARNGNPLTRSLALLAGVDLPEVFA